MTYCTAADVATLLRLTTTDSDDNRVRFEFTESTLPSLAEMNAWIAEAKAEIDKRTRTSFGIAQTTERRSIRTPYRNTGGDMRILLSRSRCREFDTDEDDKLEKWDGSEWEDISDDDGWWFDEDGIIHMSNRIMPTYYSGVRLTPSRTEFRVTYRYGYDDVPDDIKRACAMMVARRFVESDWYRKAIPTQSQESISPMSILDRYDEQIDRILERYTEYPAVTL